MLAPPLVSSDWSTVSELILITGAACKSLNSFNLTWSLKNTMLVCETLQKTGVSVTVKHTFTNKNKSKVLE